MAFNHIAKSKCHATVEELVEEVAGVIEAMGDNSWVMWAEQLMLNVTHQVREEVETRACKEGSRTHIGRQR